MSFNAFSVSSCLETAYYSALVSGSEILPDWAYVDSDKRLINGTIPENTTQIIFVVTAHSATGSRATSTVTINTYPCEI